MPPIHGKQCNTESLAAPFPMENQYLMLSLQWLNVVQEPSILVNNNIERSKNKQNSGKCLFYVICVDIYNVSLNVVLIQ